MDPHDNESSIQEKIKMLIANPRRRSRLSDAKRRELIARIYNVSEERRSIIDVIAARRMYFSSIAATLLIFIISLNYFFSPMFPTVSEVKGTVKIYRADRNEWIFAENNKIEVRNADIVKTFQDGQADIILPNLYHIRLKNNSEIMLSRACSRAFSGDIEYVLSQGRMLAYYNKTRKAGKALDIKTPQAEAAALGTDFMVETTPVLNSTMIGVLDGAVRVSSLASLRIPKEAMNEVLVRAGERTMVRAGQPPQKPARLMENELLDMEELYGIGAKTQVALLISTGANRTRELLSVTPLYIRTEVSGVLPEKIAAMAKKFNQAIREGSKEINIERIREFEEIINDYPNPQYDVQLLLFIGSYYEYLGEYRKAIAVFERVISGYPRSGLASIAQCAIGIIYEEKLKDIEKAKTAYKKVISNYPQSPEVEEAQAALSR